MHNEQASVTKKIVAKGHDGEIITIVDARHIDNSGAEYKRPSREGMHPGLAGCKHHIDTCESCRNKDTAAFLPA